MPAINTDTTTQEKIILPFHELIAMLRQHGFAIRPDDYIEMLKVVERFGIDKVEELGPRLCPLIVTSPEEQEKFYKVFDEYKKEQQTTQDASATKEDRWKPLVKKWWWLMALLLTALALFFVFRRLTAPVPLIADFSLSDLSAADSKYRAGDTILLDAGPTFQKNEEAKNNTRFFWNLGQGFQPGAATLKTVLQRPGTFNIQLKITSTGYPVKEPVKTITLEVCPAAPPVQVPLTGTEYAVGDVLVISPVFASEERFKNILWTVNSKTIVPEKDGSTLRYRFDSSGIYQVSFIGTVREGDGETSPCTFLLTLESIVVNDEKTYRLNALPAGSRTSLSPQRKLHPAVSILLLLPVVLISLFTFLWWKRNKKENKEGKKEEIKFSGKSPPYETPFENKDIKLTQQEHSFREIIRSFRQKAEDEIVAFNLPRSIEQTIRSGGVPELIFTHTLRYNDYLVLIDARLAKSMQVHLFDYLVRLLHEEAVCVERFYYTGNWEKIFNESVPDGYSFKRLSELYKSYTLIIMGDARQLVYPTYPMLEKKLADTLHEWEYKAILTPVPYKDWGREEKLISAEFVLLPADIQGQVKLIQAIREHQLHHGKYLASIHQFYETSSYDFEEVEAVETYLNDEVLFQWLCATAVFHKLRWEVVIEVGKAICARYGQPEKMNFTSLLKLSRISWMNEGAFPADMRLELLKKLDPENEVIARETLLRMMQYADTYFDADYFFQEEKEIQKTTSRFLLYAHDPERYADYEADQSKFQSLWEAGRLWDTPQKAYLENPSEKWPTLIRHHQKNVGLRRYFQHKTDAEKQKANKVLWRNGVLAGLLLLLWAGLHIFKNNLPENAFLVQSIYPESFPFTVAVADSIACENTTVSSISGTLVGPDGSQYPLSFERTGNNQYFTAQTQVHTAIDTAATGLLQVSWTTGRPGKASTLVSFGSNALETALSACNLPGKSAVALAYNDPAAKDEVAALSDFLKEQGFTIYNTGFEEFTGSTEIVYFDANDKSAADTLALILSLKDSSLFPKANVVFSDAGRYLPDSAGLPRQLLVKINYIDFETTDAFSPARLPASLNEIWQGGTSNRLMTINNSRQIIYYSTGAKNTYGTYRINEVWRKDNGVYKIIANADQQFAVFFLKSVEASSFELSVCQNRYATKEQARELDENYCDRFNRMTWYYEKDNAKIFIPFNANNTVSASRIKLKQLTDSINALRSKGYTVQIAGTLYYNTEFRWEVPPSFPDPITQTVELKSQTPFDRSYVLYNIRASRTAVSPDCNRVFMSLEEIKGIGNPLLVCRLNLSGKGLTNIPAEIYQLKNLQELDLRNNRIPESAIQRLQEVLPKARILFTKIEAGTSAPESLLTRINLDEKGYPDEEGQASLKQIIDYLKGYNTAKIRIVYYFDDNNSRKQAMAWIPVLQQYFKRYGTNEKQVDYETVRQTQVQQQQKNPTAQKSEARQNYADIYGVNFPNNFLRPRMSNTGY